MRYTIEQLNKLAKKNNTTMEGLAKLTNISLCTLYKHCRWDDNSNHSKLAIAGRKKFEKKMSEFINKCNLMKEETLIEEVKDNKYKNVDLRDAEEICYQLAQGSEVFQKCSNDSLKLVEGVIVRFRNGKAVFVNCAISLDEKYYMKIPKPIKVEIGKRYLTEKGEEAVVIAKSEYFGDSYAVCIIGKEHKMFVNEEGYSMDLTKYDIKLVEEIDD